MIITLIMFSFALVFTIGYFVTQHKINKAARRAAELDLEKQRLIRMASAYGINVYKGES